MKYYVTIPGTYGDTTKIKFAARSSHRTEAAARKAGAKIGTHAEVYSAMHGDEPMGMKRSANNVHV